MVNIGYQPNLRVKCDKHPADYCVNFDGSEVVSVFNFVVGCLRLTRVVSRHGGFSENS